MRGLWVSKGGGWRGRARRWRGGEERRGERRGVRRGLRRGSVSRHLAFDCRILRNW